MSALCEEPNPADESMTCQKAAHQYGYHFNLTTETPWAGIPLPVRTKKGDSRVKAVVDDMKPGGKTGPPLTGEQRRDVGMDKVLSNTAEEYKEAFSRQYRVVADSGSPFTSEDVTAAVGMPPGHQNAVGSLFNALLRRDLRSERVAYVGHVSAKRANQNATKIGQYRSTTTPTEGTTK